MANLTAKKRASMPKKDFAGKGKSFPVNDRLHAKLALGGATRAYRAGNISNAEEMKIKSRARGKLNDGDKAHLKSMAKQRLAMR